MISHRRVKRLLRSRSVDANFTLDASLEPLVAHKPNVITCNGKTINEGYVTSYGRLDAGEFTKFGFTEASLKSELESNVKPAESGVPPVPECPSGNFNDFVF
jgi:hypothetical protein